MQDHDDVAHGKGAGNGVSALMETGLRGAGALLSVSLLLGIIYWSFMLGQREATEVPVIRAMQGLPRLVPTDPGGAVADYQGLEVNSVLGNDSPTPVKIETTLAPDTGALSGEDRPMSTLVEMARNQAETTARDTAAALDSISNGALRVSATSVLQEVDGDGTITLLSGRPDDSDEGPLRVDAGSMLVETTDAAPADNRSVAADGMMTPLRRPENLGVTSMTDAVEDLLMQLEPEEGDTSDDMAPLLRPLREFGNPTILPGDALIQLGAYTSEEDALATWDKVVAENNDLLAGLDRVIQATESAGMTFYRLRAAGLEDVDQTRALCAALTPRGVDCIAVTQQ